MSAAEKWPVNAGPEPIEHSAPQVYSAIAGVMRLVGREGISKDRKNEQQGYKFRGIDDVYNALNAALANNGLCILPRVLKREVTERTTQKGGVLFYVVLDMEFDIVCALDGSKHTIAVVGEAMDSADKATNKAMSAAFKYACMQVFCIPTQGSDDADATTHDVAPQTVPEDCWTALSDAAAIGNAEVTRFMKEEVSEETRALITGPYKAKWDTIKAIAGANTKARKAEARKAEARKAAEPVYDCEPGWRG
jgi:hypothetical protein